MTDTDQLVDKAVARLARGRMASESARAELRDHLMDAVHERAAGAPVAQEHVDAALAAMGGRDAIRATFFPLPPRPTVHRGAAIALLAVLVVSAIAIVASRGAYIPCEAPPGGVCGGGTNVGFSDDVMLVLAPPLLVLLAMLFLPAWAAAIPATAYALLMLVWYVQNPFAGAVDAVLALGGVLTLAVALHHAHRGRVAAEERAHAA